MSAVLQWGERHDIAYGRSFTLAFAIHALLLAVLFLGVRMQSYAPDTVTVELWEPPVQVEAPPRPPPKAEPEPPKPEPKIEKPEIVEKAAPKPKPKPEPKVQPKPKPAPQRDLEMEKRMREELAREQAASQERQMRDLAASEQAAARGRALATWQDKIRAKIRGNILVPPDIVGNPEAIFDIVQLPTGEVISVRLRKSSGHDGYDKAVERAILKSSPLPKPDQPGLFEAVRGRELKLTFRPLDK